MLLADIFSPKMINLNLLSEEKDEVLEELVELFVAEHSSADRANVLQTVLEREEKMSTGIMHHIAVPHGRTDAVDGVYGVIGISREGIDYEALDDAPVHLFIMLISSTHDSEVHLRVLRRLALILEQKNFYADIMNASSSEDALSIINRYEDKIVAE